MTNRDRSEPAPETPLDRALEDTFPASDPATSSGTTANLTPLASANAARGAADTQRRCDLFVIVTALRPEEATLQRARGERRWASPDSGIVRTAQTPALAVLDLLAALEGRTPDDLVLLRVRIPAAQLHSAAELPSDWHLLPQPEHVRALGDDWARAGASLGLRVPSALCIDEYNVLLNLRHPEADSIEIRARSPFRLDRRLRI